MYMCYVEMDVSQPVENGLIQRGMLLLLIAPPPPVFFLKSKNRPV